MKEEQLLKKGIQMQNLKFNHFILVIYIKNQKMNY